MSYAMVAGWDVLRAMISMPFSGIWFADVTVDAQEKLSGRVVMMMPGLTLSGTVYRAGVYAGRSMAWIVGGAGGLQGSIKSKYYRDTPVRIPLLDIASEVSEAVAPSADTTALATMLPTWSRMGGSARAAVSSLASAAGSTWRLLADGSIWLGTDKFAEAKSFEYDVLSDDPVDSVIEIASESLPLRPGDALGGRPVRSLEHLIGATVRTRVRYG